MEKAPDIILGVGNGCGTLFVRGDYDSIKAAQAIIVERDELRRENNLLAPKVANLEEHLATALRQLERMTCERNAWFESAGFMGRATDFYRSLIVEMGKVIGPLAYTSEDGSVQSEPLALAVRDIVVARFSLPNNVAETQLPKPSFLKRIRYALRIIFTGK